jgi:hypothetical protein
VRPVVIVAVVILAALVAWHFWKPSTDEAAKSPGGADAAKSGKAGKGFGKGAGKGGGSDPNRASPSARARS